MHPIRQVGLRHFPQGKLSNARRKRTVELTNFTFRLRTLNPTHSAFRLGYLDRQIGVTLGELQAIEAANAV
jgi:hypothetical protein